MKHLANYVMGADFGSDSVRVVVLDARNGEVVASEVSYYKRWKEGLYCNPAINQFRQHPLDYIESFETAVKNIAGSQAACMQSIRALCIDTTGSTPVLCDAEGIPLSLDPRFAEDPDAMFILWKDHTAILEADEFNHLSRTWGGVDYTHYMGGSYSAEWFWAKLLHLARKKGKVIDEAVTAIEHCDWFPALLTGTTAIESIKRSRCAAGHKMGWHASWGGYPASEFLGRLDPFLGKIHSSLGNETFTSDQIAGHIIEAWATRLGLLAGIPVCVGSYDAHIGALGGHVSKGVLVKSIGTSTCDIIIGPKAKPGEPEKPVKGIAGQVDGSVIPGFIGYEAGQSAYGDYYAWFKNLLMWPARSMEAIIGSVALETMEANLLGLLEQASASLVVSESSPVALDWINGRRTPNANHTLKGALSGLSLGTDAPMVMRMLFEATAFGARAILDCFEAGQVPIHSIVAIGGVARKSKTGMQILADVTGKRIHVTSNDQAPAIGAAVCASVVAGLYPDIPTAQQALCARIATVYEPNEHQTKLYDTLYARYVELGRFEESQRRKSTGV